MWLEMFPLFQVFWGYIYENWSLIWGEMCKTSEIEGLISGGGLINFFAYDIQIIMLFFFS